MTNTKRVLTVLLLVMLVAAVGYARERSSVTGWVEEVSIEEGRLVVDVEDKDEKPTGVFVHISDPEGELDVEGERRLSKGKHVFVRFRNIEGDKHLKTYVIIPGGC